jgi:hypothetical protein
VVPTIALVLITFLCKPPPFFTFLSFPPFRDHYLTYQFISCTPTPSHICCPAIRRLICLQCCGPLPPMIRFARLADCLSCSTLWSWPMSSLISVRINLAVLGYFAVTPNRRLDFASSSEEGRVSLPPEQDNARGTNWCLSSVPHMDGRLY